MKRTLWLKCLLLAAPESHLHVLLHLLLLVSQLTKGINDQTCRRVQQLVTVLSMTYLLSHVKLY